MKTFLILSLGLFLAEATITGGHAEPLVTVIPDSLQLGDSLPTGVMEGVLEHTVVYEDLPASPDYHSNSDFNPRGMEHVYLLANTFLDLIQRNNVLPKSINASQVAEAVQGGEAQIVGFLEKHWQDVILQYIGILTTAIFGLLLAVVIPFAGFCFCCCRCAGKCGAYPSTHYDKKSDACKRVSIGILLSLFVIAALFGCVCAFVTNQYQYDGWADLSERVDNSLEDTGMYFEHTESSVKTLLVTNFQELEEVLGNVLDESGPILKTSLAKVTQAMAIDNLTNIVSGLGNVKRDLKDILNDARTLDEKVEQLRQGLNKSQTHLNAALSQCASNTACANFLSEFDIDRDLAMAEEFTNVKFNMPEVVHTIQDITDLIENDIEKKVEIGKQQLDNVEVKIKDSIEDIKPKIKDEIRKMGTELENRYSDIQLIFNQIDDNLKVQKDVKMIDDYTKEYVEYRYYIGLGMSALITLVLVCFILGLFYGMCGRRPGGLYGDECCNKGTGANFLLSGIYLTFLFSFILLVLTTAHFIVGAAMEKMICETITSPEQSDLFSELDRMYFQPKLQQHLGHAEGVSAAGLIASCHGNDTIYNILHLEQKYNLSQFTDWRTNYGIGAYIENLKNKIQLRDLADITLLSPETSRDLEELAKSKISDMNFTRFTDLIEDQIVNIDLASFTRKLRGLKQQVGRIHRPIASALENEALWLDTMNRVVEEMKVTVRHLKSSVINLEENSRFNHSSMRDAIKNLISQANRATEYLQSKGPELISDLTESYVSEMVNLIDDYVERVVDKSKYEVGFCAPLSNSFNATRVAFCNEIVDPFNGFWASIGWCFLLYLPCIALSVSLVSLYRKSEPYPGPLVEATPLETRGDDRGKKARKGHRRNPSGYLPEYTHSRPQPTSSQGHAYTDMRYSDGGRFRDIAPRNWDGESAQPPRYTSNPSLAQPTGEYERPPPYYYPGPQDPAK